jgi:hypothetical protein
MKVMGHTDVLTSMLSQHPVLDSIREAIDLRNSRHNPRHSEGAVRTSCKCLRGWSRRPDLNW